MYYEEYDGPHNTLNKKKYCVPVFVVLFLVLSYLPPFDTHNLLLPRADDVETTCTLVGITTYQNITSGFIFVAGADDISVSLYTTTVVRMMSCIGARRHNDDNDPKTFSYTKVYINMSYGDIDRELDMISLQYTEPTQLWKYDPKESFLLRSVIVDRHGFSEEPIDIYRDWTHANIIMKSLVFVISLAVTALLYFVFVVRRRK
jgi:hypothetical protein